MKSAVLWCAAAVLVAALPGPARAQAPAAQPPTLDAAQQLFYNARYAEAAQMALAVRTAQPDDLGAYELRTSALHFQIKRAIGDPPDKAKALAGCAICPEVLTAFADETSKGLAVARARLAADPQDLSAMFFVGKLDLNHLWLHLGTLGKKTGWDEYWEARKSLDAVLKANPDHIRARVARAWMDYIVGTKVPWGTRWLLGGGNKKKGLAVVAEAAQMKTDFFVQAEARFGLWEMLVREKRVKEALAAARELHEQFPENPEVTRYIEQHK
jgi:tetratricopeptide (TPR) repeat protein